MPRKPTQEALRAAKRALAEYYAARAAYDEAHREMVNIDAAHARVAVADLEITNDLVAAYRAGTFAEWKGWEALREAREREMAGNDASEKALQRTLSANTRAGEAMMAAGSAAVVALERLLQAHGVGGKTAARWKKTQRESTKKRVQDARRRGTTQTDAAKMLGISRTTVQKYWNAK